MCQWLTAGRLHLIKDKVWKKSITSATQIVLIFTLSLLIISIPGKAAEYGEINVTTANDETWSTLLSNNVSNVVGDITGNAFIATTLPMPYTGVSVNSNKSIYLPGETAGLDIVLLDRKGTPLTGADVNLGITAPDAVTYSLHDEIVEIGGGVYRAAFDHTGVEGRYWVNASAVIDGRERFFDTYFLVCSEYDFDIIRTAESVIDPTVQDRFDVVVDIVTRTDAGTVVIKERVPSVFTVSTDADVTRENDTTILTWHKDLLDGRTSVNYSYSVPMVCPKLYELGAMEIGWDGGRFVETGRWYVAVDPTTFDETPDTAVEDDTTNVITEVSTSDDIYATLDVRGGGSGDSTDWIESEWNDNGIPDGSAITSVTYYFEHKESTTSSADLTIEWWDGSTWTQVYDPDQTTTETTSSCDLSSSIDTVSEANNVKLRYKWVSVGGGSTWRYTYLDYEHLKIVYNQPPSIEIVKTYNSSLIEKRIFAIGENVTIRANVTDVDGASDITGVNITIISPNSTVMVNNASMTDISAITNGSIYEYNYTAMPVDSTSVGTWNVVIYANDAAGQTSSSTTFSAYRNYLRVNTNATDLYVNETVLIYGTVTNLSNNTAVSGATVNISITYPDGSLASFTQKTTNSQGEYNTTYTVSPTDPLGIYTVAVNTSDGLGNITTNSTTFEVIINPNIRVVTNRYVILDDPNSGSAGAGYSNPPASSGENWWDGENTRIRAYALVINETGMPAIGTPVTFTLKYPNGTILDSSSNATDSHGTARYSYNLNAQNYYGEWTLNASATVDGNPLNATTIFIYDWWGCAGSGCHGVTYSWYSPSVYLGTVTSRSPYLAGYDRVHSDSYHDSTEANCSRCHRSYGDASYYPSGKHSDSNKCTDCHGTPYTDTTNGYPTMYSCYDSSCHANADIKQNSNLTEISTFGTKSEYSGDPINPAMAHSHYLYSYADLWDMPADLPAPTDFDSGLNYTANTFNNTNISTANDDGWDWADGVYVTGDDSWEDEEWVSAADNPFASNGAIMIELDTYSGGHTYGSPGVTIGGAFGIQINVTQELYDILSDGGIAEVSFKYAAWDTDLHYSLAGSDNGCEEEGVIKARFGNSSIMHWLGTDTADTIDSYPDVDFYSDAKEDSAYVRAVYNVTDYITGAGWYYLELGAIQNDWNDEYEEGRRFFFDDVSLYFYSSEPAVPCIICHSPMHNITNPNPDAETTSYTEDSHCTVCHKAMKKHDNEVGCTVCHSQDSHIKAYFNFNGTYSGDPGDCSVCHEDEHFDTILSQPKAGLYTGPTLNLLIPTPSTHSDNESAGQLWGDYWYDREEMCIFCHSKSYHTIETAGRIEEFKGDSIYNGLISADSFWCGKCHYIQNPDYLDMVDAFNSSGLEIPPEITGNNTYWDNGSIILEEEPYVNHSAKQYDVNYSDDECKDCHGLMSMTRSDQFQHRVLVGSIGGSDCVDPLCHGGTSKINNAGYVNYTILKQSMHRDLNSNVSYTQTLTDEIDKACWACHANGTETDHRGLRPGKDSYQCRDCHFINRTTQGEAYNKYYPVPNPNVTEHTEYSIDIKTNVSGIGTCYGCHNNSINQNHNDPEVTDWSRISHYGTNETLMTATINSSNCTYCHIDLGQASDNVTLREMWGTPPTINSSNASSTHYSVLSTSDCYSCHMSTGEMPYSFHQLEMRYDQVPPGVKITSPTNTTYTSNSIYLNYTVNETTWNEYYNLNNMENITLIGETATESGNRSFLLTVPNGNHTITVYAEDVSNNLGHGLVNFSVNVSDTEPPVTTITNLSDPVAGNRTINATITDSNSIIINATYYIENSTYWGGTYNSGNITMTVVDGAWDELAENVTASFAAFDLSDGNYTIHVRGQDETGIWGGGNWGAYDSLNFTVAGYGVNITITPKSQSVLQGSDVQYTVTVTNRGSNETDTIDLTLSNTNNFDFETSLTKTSFTLASGASDTAVMTVTAKAGAEDGASTITTITGTSHGYGSKTDSDNCTTTVVTTPPGLMVTTNRYVILDDPASWESDDWNGEDTTIRVYVLVMNTRGTPDAGATVNITLENPDGVVINSTSTTTDERGVAKYLFDLNNQDNWGTWIINVTAPHDSVMRSFKYNQWGCGRCHTWYRDPAGYGIVTPNSPYMEGYDKMHIVSRGSRSRRHTSVVSNSNCLYCHQSYGTGTAPSQYPDGYHQSKRRCQDCHNNDFTSGNGIPEMRSCYNASCHPQQNTNLSSLSTLNSSVTDSDGYARTNYSDTPPTPTGSPGRAHDPDHNLFCIQCHGPMHTITKPNATVETNTYTEDLHCVACHKPGRTEHNGTVNCTICHSQDAHRIMFFNGTGSFNQGKSDAGNCTTCHQDRMWATILSSSNVSTYTGSSAPSIAKPLNHSDNASAGARWGSYWTTDQSACEYCHNKTYHSSNALGRLSYWNGNNTINSSVDSNSTWCASCHYEGYESGTENYTDMVTKFTNDGVPIPPEITTGEHAPNTTLGFYEHIFTDDHSDRLCRECHEKKVNASSHATPFMHNLTAGDCENCHYDATFLINKERSDKFVNSTMYEASVHGNRTNIWCWDCHTTSNHPPEEYYWKWCECCHSYQSDFLNETSRHNVRETPGESILSSTNCTVCHDETGYYNATGYYNSSAEHECRWCHILPDRIFPRGVSV